MAIFGGYSCVDPWLFAQECAAANPPIPTDRWRDKAGAFHVSLGRDRGHGWFLIRKAELDRIDAAADHELTFVGADGDHVRTLSPITLLSAECVDPGAAADPNATYLIELVDRRHHLAKIPVDKGYNVRAADGTAYLTQTLNSGVAWTWAQIVTDLATTLGIAPLALPFTPDATPENFRFYGGFAWAALCDVLDRLACAVEYDPEANSFTIVRLGAADAVAAAAQTALVGDRLWDGYSSEAVRGWRPEKVNVLFRRKPRPKDGSSPFYIVPITLAATAGVKAGTYVNLKDDLAALGATGTPSNSAACSTRASERAADWLRKRGGFERPLLRVYRDFQNGAALLGSTIGHLSYDDRGGPWATAIQSKPDGALEKWGGEGACCEGAEVVEPPADPEENSIPVFTIVGNVINSSLQIEQYTFNSAPASRFTQYNVVNPDTTKPAIRQFVFENSGGGFPQFVINYHLTGTANNPQYVTVYDPTFMYHQYVFDNSGSPRILQYIVTNPSLNIIQAVLGNVAGTQGEIKQFVFDNDGDVDSVKQTVKVDGATNPVEVEYTLDGSDTLAEYTGKHDFSGATVTGLSSGGASVTTYAISEADFTAAATTQTITLATLGARFILLAAWLEVTTGFSGGGLSGFTLTVIRGGQNILAVSSLTTNFGQVYALSTSGTGALTFGSTTTLQVKADSVSANVNAATAGAAKLHVYGFELPT